MLMRPVNPFINSRPLNQFPSLCERIQCPICCIEFQGQHKPMISCENRHTICMRCLEAIIDKAGRTPEANILCPICRQRIHLPLQSDQEFNEFMKLISTMGSLYKSYEQQRQELSSKNLRIHMYQNQVPKKDLQISNLKRDLNAAERLVEMLRLENSSLKFKLSKKAVQTDFQDNQGKKEEQKENSRSIIVQNKDKKLSLSAFIDDMTSSEHLNLAKRNFNKVQIEYMVMYDMSGLLELNLNFNNLGNEGLQLLIRQQHTPQLKVLKLCNNLITQLPSMRNICHLEVLDLSNYHVDSKEKANKISPTFFYKLLDEKWPNLKELGVESKLFVINVVESDRVWDRDENLDKIVEQWPVISRLEISKVCSAITKTKCQRIASALNLKAKRPSNNRIKVNVQML